MLEPNTGPLQNQYALLTAELFQALITSVFQGGVWWGAGTWFETGTHCVALAGLELTKIVLLLPPECWDNGVFYQAQFVPGS